MRGSFVAWRPALLRHCAVRLPLVTSSVLPVPAHAPDQLGLLEAAVTQAFNAVVITSAVLEGDGPLIVYCNPAFCVMTGYTAAELLGKSPRMLQGPLTDRDVLATLRDCLYSGQYFQGSTFNYRKDGSTYLVEWNISPVLDAQGKIQAFVSVQRDITAKVRAEQRQALLARALDATPDAVLIADQQANILFVNQAFEHLTGYSSAEVLGCAPRFLQSGQHPPAFYQQLRDALGHGESFQATFASRHKDGRLYHIAQTITPLKDQTGVVQHYVSVGRDVTELIARTRELRQQAHHDALTGLLNRRAGEKQLQLCQQTAQAEHRVYSLIMGDIDEFKQINDRFGHEVGDRILQHCAKLLSASVRSDDAIARWGGEEFLIVLPGCPRDAAQELAEHIRTALAAHEDAIVGRVTMSLGVATWRQPEDSTELLRRTDQALYLAKQSGRNQVAVAP